MFYEDDCDDWIIRVYTFSGLSYTYMRGTLNEMRYRVDDLIKLRQKRGCEVVQLSEHKWEVQEPEDSVLVSDACGYICLKHSSEVSPEILRGYA